LDALLEMGVKSIGWDFSANIERAKEQGFEPIELLQHEQKLCIIAIKNCIIRFKF
jgi:hypothetical protein